MTTPADNKSLVLNAFEVLFNQRNYAAAAKLWSPNYVQHSAHIPPGRDGLFDLTRSAPADMGYEPGLVLADGNVVMVHGRYRNVGQAANWIVVDIVRVEEGLLVEHWDVIQDEATRAASKSGQPMFGAAFPAA